MFLCRSGNTDFDIYTVRHSFTMSGMTVDTSHRLKSSISWSCWGPSLIRSLRLKWSAASTEFLLISLMFLEISCCNHVLECQIICGANTFESSQAFECYWRLPSLLEHSVYHVHGETVPQGFHVI